MATYASLAELKAQLRISDTSDDAQLTLALEAATEAADLAMGLVTTSDALAVTGVAATNVLTSAAHGLEAATGVQLVGTLAGGAGLAVGTQYYVLNPATDTLQLAATVGGAAVDFSTDLTAGLLRRHAQLNPVPASVKLATIVQAVRWYKRPDAPYGVLGSPEFGNFSRLLSQLDPDVEVLLSGYGHRTRWGTVG